MTGPGSAWDRQHALAELRRCGKCWWRSPLSGNAPHQENQCIDGCIRAFLTVASAELPEARLAADQLGQDEAHRGEHGEAPVVELLVAHVHVVHAQADGVAEVARLLLRVLGPDLGLLGGRRTGCIYGPDVC